MAQSKMPANPWLRGALIGAGVLVVGGIALGSHGNGTTTPPSVPIGSVSTPTYSASASVPIPATSAATSAVVAPVGTTVPAYAPATTQAVVPQQGSRASGGSQGSCGTYSYRNSDGRCVHDPVQATAAPTGATARCNDGTYSFSQHRSGTCSGHRGVAEWLS
jgi:hypothetical protein